MFSSKSLKTSYTCPLNDLETICLKNLFEMFTGVTMVTTGLDGMAGGGILKCSCRYVYNLILRFLANIKTVSRTSSRIFDVFS